MKLKLDELIYAMRCGGVLLARQRVPFGKRIFTLRIRHRHPVQRDRTEDWRVSESLVIRGVTKRLIDTRPMTRFLEENATEVALDLTDLGREQPSTVSDAMAKRLGGGTWNE